MEMQEHTHTLVLSWETLSKVKAKAKALWLNIHVLHIYSSIDNIHGTAASGQKPTHECTVYVIPIPDEEEADHNDNNGNDDDVDDDYSLRL